MSIRRRRQTPSQGAPRRPRPVPRASRLSRLGQAIARVMFRVLFMLPRRLAQPRPAQAGFILPTVVLLLLVVSLTVGSITLRTFTRTTQAIGDRQQQVIQNAATPAIDRAKAKLEYLFNVDERLPSGIPGETQLVNMMANDDQVRDGFRLPPRLPNNVNPYQFPDETPVELDGNAATLDNAWSFEADADGDGNPDAFVAYSIIFQTPQDITDLEDTRPATVRNRAGLLQVRNAPLSSTAPPNPQCNAGQGAVEGGWFSPQTSTATVSKNFQVDAIVLPLLTDEQGQPTNISTTGTVATLEFEQDRKIDQGNKWGAWFRNDLEVFPGPPFRWNGAMHTEGNLIAGNRRFQAFLISSNNSCLNTSPDNSEITVGNRTGISLVRDNVRSDINDDDFGPGSNGDFPFLGQVISGRVLEDDNLQTSNIHTFNGGIADIAPTLVDESDSLINNLDQFTEVDFALDPVRLLTEDVSQPRAFDDENQPNDVLRQDEWNTAEVEEPQFDVENRIYNRSQPRPRVGDSYRADNRAGPQARYDDYQVSATPITNSDGVRLDLGPAGTDIPLSNTDLTRNSSLAGDTDVGLDGYWERRAIGEGLRIIVGERLTLGSPFGWGGPADPLNPFQACGTENPNDASRCHEARQRRSLVDSLAAVQATVVYHTANPNPANTVTNPIPMMCLATTVHPGTAQTLQDSATFEALQIPGPLGPFPETTILTDFFTGRGTNGWEFDYPYANAGEIATAVSPTDPMGIALRNLANFAGDPRGGAPSFPPVQDTEVHPFPLMSMWGDFSRLRRILDSGTAYASLSAADRSTLDTAICTMGMLAYNIDYLNRFEVDPAINAEYGTAGTVELQAIDNLGLRLADIIAGGTVPPDASIIERANTDPPEAFIDSLEAWNALEPDPALGGVSNTMLAIARVVANKDQVSRDRLRGFNAALAYNSPLAGTALEPLAAAGNTPKYPILRALFPPATAPGLTEAVAALRGGTANNYMTADVNVGQTYEPVDTVSTDADGLDNLALIRLRMVSRRSPTDDWVLPIDGAAYASGATPDTVNPNGDPTDRGFSFIRCVDLACGSGTGPVAEIWRVPIKDSALFDGRERMSVRALNVDLDILRREVIGGDFWLPESGIVFAFREDAVREDAIVRPTDGVAAAACATFTDLEANLSCKTNAEGDAVAASFDPPLTVNALSVKPVDFIPDPDRRPHGFRMMNGRTLKRTNDDLARGMSFITDNSVYIQGNFNLHEDGNPALNAPITTPIEEFGDLVANFVDADWPNRFYARNGIDARFANPAVDNWRPTEILADGVSIISNAYCDGSIADGFVTAGANNTAASVPLDQYGCGTGDGLTSYLNQRRPSTAPADWQRQNQFDTNADSPIVVTRNGTPVTSTGPYTGSIFNVMSRQDNALIEAQETRVNVSMISGIVPSREGQSYGGLHNFPRLQESWEDPSGGNDDIDLSMSGTFIQLNFSTSATAPYDHEAWERGETINPARNQDDLPYYAPPERRWGYDVALQFVPAAPIAQRFSTLNPNRSEFYNEPALDDPYIAQLCRSAVGQAGYNANFCPVAN
ncbi:MAG: hormogonium polysaccharide biosynthesis protein HpsA [Elainellaceae cyanobacterium]